MVAHNPFHGSGRAGLPHPALASGDNAEAAQGDLQRVKLSFTTTCRRDRRFSSRLP